jgi:SAM-dependent methyltransferase
MTIPVRIMETQGMEPFQALFYLGMERELLNLATPSLPPVLGGPMRRLNLGAGSKVIPGTEPLDLPEWDADKMTLPVRDESVSEIYALHFLEHVKDPIKVLRECQRVLYPGGVLNIVVPYYNASIAAMDLDHKHAFNEDTWKTLFSNQYYDKNSVGWKFRVHFNLIAGIVERNLALFTQLVRT